MAGKSLESEVKLTKVFYETENDYHMERGVRRGEFKKSSELDDQQETLPKIKKSDKDDKYFRSKDNLVVRVKNGSSETKRSISDCS